MTSDRLALVELIEKGPDLDLLREMMGCVAQRLMDVDVQALCGAGYSERGAQRANPPNRHRERDWETRAGRYRARTRSCAAGAASRGSCVLQWDGDPRPKCGQRPRATKPYFRCSHGSRSFRPGGTRSTAATRKG